LFATERDILGRFRLEVSFSIKGYKRIMFIESLKKFTFRENPLSLLLFVSLY